MSKWIEGYPIRAGLYVIIDLDGDIAPVSVFDVEDYYPDCSLAYQYIGDENYHQVTTDIKRYRLLELE